MSVGAPYIYTIIYKYLIGKHLAMFDYREVDWGWVKYRGKIYTVDMFAWGLT